MGCPWAKNCTKLAVSDFAERVSQKLLGQFPPTQVYLKRLDVYVCTGMFICPLTHKWAAHGAKNGLKLAVTDFAERVSQKLPGQFPPTQVYLNRLDV